MKHDDQEWSQSCCVLVLVCELSAYYVKSRDIFLIDTDIGRWFGEGGFRILSTIRTGTLHWSVDVQTYRLIMSTSPFSKNIKTRAFYDSKFQDPRNCSSSCLKAVYHFGSESGEGHLNNPF